MAEGYIVPDSNDGLRKYLEKGKTRLGLMCLVPIDYVN